jgi:hypothetical protein
MNSCMPTRSNLDWDLSWDYIRKTFIKNREPMYAMYASLFSDIERFVYFDRGTHKNIEAISIINHNMIQSPKIYFISRKYSHDPHFPTIDIRIIFYDYNNPKVGQELEFDISIINV